jgi:hypothetical protein
MCCNEAPMAGAPRAPPVARVQHRDRSGPAVADRRAVSGPAPSARRALDASEAPGRSASRSRDAGLPYHCPQPEAHAPWSTQSEPYLTHRRWSVTPTRVCPRGLAGSVSSHETAGSPRSGSSPPRQREQTPRRRNSTPDGAWHMLALPWRDAARPFRTPSMSPEPSRGPRLMGRSKGVFVSLSCARAVRSGAAAQVEPAAPNGARTDPSVQRG